MAAKAYATIKNRNGQAVRLCGQLDPAREVVWVHITNGPRLGGFRLSRFGGTLTAKTLAGLFSTGEGLA